MSEYRSRPETKSAIVLVGDRVELVALAERHLPLVIAWRNDPGIRQRFFNRRILTAASQLDWFARYAGDSATFCFAIKLKHGRTIGMVGLKVDWTARMAEFGRFIIGDPLSVGRGYGREAAQLVLDFARSQLALGSVFLVVFPDNAVAVHLYESLGFVEESMFPRETSDGVATMAKKMLLTFEPSRATRSPESDSVPS